MIFMASFNIFVAMLAIALFMGIIFSIVIEISLRPTKELKKNKHMKRLKDINLYYIIGVLFAFVESVILLILNP